MKQLELQPVTEKREYYEALEKALAELFRREIFLPLLAELGEDKAILKNSSEYDVLIRAISDGDIRYVSGAFEGEFNASISKALKGLGATWEKQGRWKLPRSKLTYDMRAAMEAAEWHFQAMAEKLDRKLAKIVPEEIADKMKLDKLFDTALFRVNKDLEKTLAKISIKPTLTPEQKKLISDRYAQNLKLSIKEWADDEILQLRYKISKNTYAGNRYEGMIKTIQASYSVSRSKAKFLARQETSLLMSAYTESRYRDAGVKKYRWRCVVGSPNHPVRPMHKALDGKVFSWDDPPIVDEKGQRKHPGQDYNCRCHAIPIVQFSEK